MNLWKTFFMLILLCGGYMAIADCTESRCAIKRPSPQSPPPALLRVINKNVQSDGGFRLDKGSGVMITHGNTLFVLTASHIFREGVGEITVTLLGGRTLPATLLLRNELWDVVVFRVDFNLDVDPITLASQPTVPGEPTVAWGFGSDGRALGRQGTAVGYVRAKNSGSHETLKTTGRAREGDSGGPVLNSRGELVGLLWGTDGQYTYSTFSGRLQMILDELRNENKRNNEFLPQGGFSEQYEPENIEQENDSHYETLKKLIAALYPLTQVKSIQTAAAILGLGTPSCFALYALIRLARNKIKSEIDSGNSAMTTAVTVNDAYAEQLNSLYELSGHSTAADATLGRLYDIKLRDAEESSSDEIAKLAKMLRKQVAEQFLRIHSSNPAPAEK